MGMVAVIVIVSGLICSLSFWAYLGEKKAFNKGRCPKCYGELKHFDTDSQGGKGYCCENRDYYTWVSYPFIIEGAKA